MLIASLAVVAVVALVLIVIYNSLVKLRVLTENAWSDIGVHLKRRHDLVPNLVGAVEGYVSHEKGTLTTLVETRNRALQAAGPAEVSRQENLLTSALKSVFALAEAYPQLRASENFAQLQTELAAIEKSIQGARRYYNASVRDLNTRVAQFPSNLVAGVFGFRARDFFEIDSAEAENPQVKFQ